MDIIEEGDDDVPPLYGFITLPKASVGVKSFHGQFGMMVRAYTYIRMHGPDGLRQISEICGLECELSDGTNCEIVYHLPYDRICMHEFVVEGIWRMFHEVHALDIAKRMMDYNLHPPTNYFPLIVHEALMIEPTETESKQTLDSFAEVMLKIAEEAHSDPRTSQIGSAHNPGRSLG